MKNRLACIQCFVAQEGYIPLEEFNHKIYLFVVYDIFFTVILKKKTMDRTFWPSESPIAPLATR